MRRIRQIGKGGFGMVDLYQNFDGVEYAVKEMLKPWDGTMFERFKREIKIVSSLNHENIIPIVGYKMHGTRPLYVMPYYKDGSIRERISRLRAKGQVYSIEAASGIIYYLADALSHAHINGVIHRDLKPDNVLFDGEKPMLADWGIGKFIHQESTVLTKAGIGTPNYCSPEQWLNEDVDGRTDIYALGIMYRELVSGSINGRVDDNDVNAIIESMTCMSLTDRFQSMEEVKSAISDLRIINEENPLRDFWGLAASVAVGFGVAYLVDRMIKSPKDET